MPSVPFSITISPIEEKDFNTLVPIQYQAFHGFDKLHMLIYPAPTHPIPSSVIQKTISRQVGTLNSGKEKGLHWLKAVDGEEKILGSSKWYFYSDEGTGRWKDDSPPAWVSPSQDPERPNAGAGVDDLEYISYIMANMNTFRRKNFVGPGILLDLLFVDPEAQGKGVGKKLVEWGTKQADEKGVRTWVEAGYKAKGMYESCGFVAVEDVIVNRAGGEGWKEEWKNYQGERVGYWFMVREPKALA